MLSAPDMLRQALGAADTLRIVRAAWMDAAAVESRWEARVPARPAASQSTTNAMFASSPDHDPRVLEAITRGASNEEISRVRAQVATEFAGRKAARRAREQSRELWVTGRGKACGTAARQ